MAITAIDLDAELIDVTARFGSQLAGSLQAPAGSPLVNPVAHLPGIIGSGWPATRIPPSRPRFFPFVYSPRRTSRTDARDWRALLPKLSAPRSPEELLRALSTVARARGMSELARQSGISREALYRALSESGNPTLDTLVRVLKALGVRLAVAV